MNGNNYPLFFEEFCGVVFPNHPPREESDMPDGFDSSYDHIPGVPLPAKTEADRFRKQEILSEGTGGVGPGGSQIVIRTYQTSDTAVEQPEIGEWQYEAQPVFSSPLYVNVDVNDLIQDHGEEKAYEILGKLKDLLA